MNYLHNIQYIGCHSCKKSCAPQELVNHNCNECNKKINPCSTLNPLCNNCNDVQAVGSVESTSCYPLPCLEGCSESYKSDCIVLNEHCFVDSCNCDNEPITLDMWILAVCEEVKKMKIDIECIKAHVPVCGNSQLCTTPVVTNITF